jgi:hypothetical protein
LVRVILPALGGMRACLGGVERVFAWAILMAFAGLHGEPEICALIDFYSRCSSPWAK